MNRIKTVNTLEELKRVFNFISKTFYEDSIEYNEHYYIMSERYVEMKKQFEIDNDLLMYIEKNENIIAAITGKGMKKEEEKITLGVVAVSKEERKKGLGKKLILEFEKRCSEKNLKHIDLGSRFRVCSIYEKLGYKPSLMIQVFDFVTIEDIRIKNKFKLEEKCSWQGENYGFIIYKVNDIKKEYIEYFESSVKTAHVQFLFDKEL